MGLFLDCEVRTDESGQLVTHLYGNCVNFLQGTIELEEEEET